MEYFLFGLFTLMVLGGGLLVVTQRNIVNAAGALVLSLFGVAGFFVLLSADFLAAVQVLVYIGAIAVLIIFTVMLTRRVADAGQLALNNQWVWVLGIAVVVFGLLVWVINTQWPVAVEAAVVPKPVLDPTKALGLALLDPEGYLLPFEVASVLLLGAMVGAIVIAREKHDE